MRVDPKTKEVLDMWEFQVLKNWAYSRRTFVLVSVGEGGGEQREWRKGAGGSRGTRGGDVGKGEVVNGVDGAEEPGEGLG